MVPGDISRFPHHVYLSTGNFHFDLPCSEVEQGGYLGGFSSWNYSTGDMLPSVNHKFVCSRPARSKQHPLKIRYKKRQKPASKYDATEKLIWENMGLYFLKDFETSIEPYCTTYIQESVSYLLISS